MEGQHPRVSIKPKSASSTFIAIAILSVALLGSGKSAMAAGPSISSLSPTSGSVGASVTINGANFGTTQGTSTVSFHGAAASPSSWSSTKIVAPVPSGATTGTIGVTVGGQTVQSSAFTVVPVISAISPVIGGIGTVVTISGTGFGASQGTSTVTFNGTAATVSGWSSTQITVPVPLAAATGTISVKVGGTNRAERHFHRLPLDQFNLSGPRSGGGLHHDQWSKLRGESGHEHVDIQRNIGNAQKLEQCQDRGSCSLLALQLVRLPSPWALRRYRAAHSPLYRPSRRSRLRVAASSVTIKGRSFGTDQGASIVAFNGVPASPTSWSSTKVVARVPSGASTGPISVTIDGQTAQSGTFGVAPGITDMQPRSGPPIATTVTIVGANFGAAQGTSTVDFNGTIAIPTSWSDTKIIAPVPRGATSGSVTVKVGSLSDGNWFFTITSPAITSIWPTTGSMGMVVTIGGSSFGSAQADSTVSFNGTLATPLSWSDGQIIVSVPAGATTGPISVTVGGLTGQKGTFSIPPTISSLSPVNGPAGTVVTINGINFGATQGASSVTFNGLAAAPSSWSDTRIVVPVPSGATTGNVAIQVGGVSSNTPTFIVTTGALSPVLQLNIANTPATVNLTDPLNADWVAWVSNGATVTAIRKAGTPSISDVSPLNMDSVAATSGIGMANAPNGTVRYSWTDGTPTATASSVATHVYTPNVAAPIGLQITVPADTTVRTLKVYAGMYRGATISASISDGSSPAISDSSVFANSEADRIYSIDFRAASAGQTLTVQLMSTETNGGSYVSLQAAALQIHVPQLTILSPQQDQAFSTGAAVPLGADALQFDSTVATVQLTANGTAVSTMTAPPYLGTWNPAAPGHYLIQGQATDGSGLSGTAQPVEMDVIGSGGTLYGGHYISGYNTDLTTEGTADWMMFAPATSNDTGPSRKAGVLPMISSKVIGIPLTFNSSCQYDSYNESWCSFGLTFEDGTPDPQLPGQPIIPFEAVRGVGNGFELTVDADTTLRMLTLYFGIDLGHGRLRAFLSDGSTPAFTDDSVDSAALSNVRSRSEGIYYILFQAASPGQKLTVRWTLIDGYLDSGLWGDIDLYAATLSGPPAGTLPPQITAVKVISGGSGYSVFGTGFGTDQGSNTVLLNGVPLTVTAWTTNRIDVVAPVGTCGGAVTVVKDGVSTNPGYLNVPQSFVIMPSAATLVAGETIPLHVLGSACNSRLLGANWSIQSSSSAGAVTLSNDPEPILTAVNPGTVTISASLLGTSATATFQIVAPVNGGPSGKNPWAIALNDSAGNTSLYNSVEFGGKRYIEGSIGSGCSSCSIRGASQQTHDPNGYLLTDTDALGHTRYYSYDSEGNVASESAQLDTNTFALTAFTYNQFGEVLTTTDPLGNTTMNAYDANGNLLSVTAPSPDGITTPGVTHFAYDPKGQMTQITDSLGNVTNLTYTAAGLVASITDAQQNVTSYEYDAHGNRTAIVDALHNRTTFALDLGDRLVSITYPDNTSASFAYDGRGRRTSATDPNGKKTIYAYDDADRLVSTTDAALNTTQYVYDAENNLLSTTDAAGRGTTFVYDANGRVTQTIFPSNLSESYVYDALGKLTSKTDRKGQTIGYLYDALDRLAHKSYPDGTGVDFIYDLAGKVQRVNDPTGTYSFAYDNMGRLLGTTTTYSFLPGRSFTNAYAYDAASNRKSFTAPDGSVSTYTFDTLNRLTDLTNSWAGHFGFGYDGLGRETQMTRPNSVNTNYRYDSVSRLLSVLHQKSGATIDGASYTNDNAGNRTAKQNLRNGITENYSYDALNQLTQVLQGGTPTESYTFDQVGNRQSLLAVGPYQYNNSNELISGSGNNYFYDNNGNTTGKADSSGATSYTWDAENRLTAVTLASSDNVTFKYDPFGRRIQKVRASGTTIYIYNGESILEELDSEGNQIARYTQSAVIDVPLAMARVGIVSFYEQDGLGSITSLTDATGAITKSYAYDSFGHLSSFAGTTTNSIRYTGREDDGTGLYYYRARYYDPTVGRFINEDPMRFRAGVNFYTYVLNNPVLLVDPLGLCPQGTHTATPDEIVKILAAGQDIAGQKLTYQDIKCNQLVDRAINKAFPGALSQQFNTTQIGSDQGPFEQTDSPAVGDLALLKKPGHVVLVTQTLNGKITQFLGSQTSTGPAYVKLPDYYWKGKFDEQGNVRYYKICLPN